MNRFVNQLTTRSLYTAFVLVITVAALFLDACFALYCYCNFVNPPTSYMCRAPLLYERNSKWETLSQSTCKIYTFGLYKKPLLLFEGFSDDLLLLFTTFGSLCDIGFVMGTATGFIIIPYLWYYSPFVTSQMQIHRA